MSPPEPAVAAACVERGVLLARAYLSRVAEPPAAALAAFVEDVGAVEAAERVRRGAVPEKVARQTEARRGVDRAQTDLACAEGIGARLLVPEDSGWPRWPFAAFALTGDPDLAPPLALWVRGPARLAELSERAVAVVGARAATGYGVHIACDIAGGLAERECTVVSGAAIGIDGAAHRGALAAGGPTVAVLACGIDRAYPAAHAALLHRIGESGLVVTEYPPTAVPARHRFLVRNRLLAGMAGGTLLVEAGLRSGAQRTAADALALGRLVMAVPGPVTSGMSAGCHELIRKGALLVSRVEEVLEAVGRLGIDLAAEPDRPVQPTDGLDPVQVRVHDALPARAARDICWLMLESGLPIEVVRPALVELERRGLAEYREGRWQRPSWPRTGQR
ncbi:DNA-processing protein DprA [Pseudonocardia asaccharolytica]|uniref:DNA protecting protein DprA n=1 Tax=Pseudonocardia asaccharolytica DSM 44247 = NBRC 16224 TaxID=1123024 RepID=A0A511CZ03_9PSEU|nr:DNA-processing protein DprA [Pseudonocardia asaccharolytica]GEL17781.1 DNA protecting protein DprA [Pseudonocardia asaccharolytica DSM 44247 = NBRC 16224]